MKKMMFVIAIIVVLLAGTVGVQPAVAKSDCTDGYEPNDDIASARSLQSGSIQATICPTGDLDIYKISVSSGDSVYVSLTNLPADFDMGLYSNNRNNWITKSENGNTSNEEINWTASENDIVYIVVWAYGNNVASRTPYTLILRHSRSASSNSTIRSQLSEFRPLLTQSDYDSLVEAMQYATDVTQCIAEIKSWQAAGIIIANDPDAINACSQALGKITEIMGKVIKPNVVGGIENCADIYFGRTVRGAISDSNPSQNYCFEVGGRQYVSIRMFDASDSNPTLDTLIELYDENDYLIASNDDGPGIGYNSFLSFQLPGGGVYGIVAARYSGTGSYWLRIEDGRQSAPGDVNRDCVVNDSDGNLIRSTLGGNDSRYDIDLNGSVNTRDWNFFLRSMGVSCP